MITREQVIKKIEQEELDFVGACFGFKVASELGIFIEVEEEVDLNSRRIVTFIELNHVDGDNTYEPIRASIIEGTDKRAILHEVEELVRGFKKNLQ